MHQQPAISRRNPASPDGANSRWWELRLYTPGWREDQAPELNETLRPVGGGRAFVALGGLVLVAGLGLRVCAVRTEAAPAPPRPVVAAPQASPAPPPGPTLGARR
jgi:hypothetical protein